jgi:lysozyme family protein
MSDFNKCVQFIFERECVYKKGHYGKIDDEHVIWENVSKDPGGLTKWGIDQRSHKDVDIKNLTEEQAEEIYRKEYWDKYHCEQLEWPLNVVHFDGCVNMGAKQSIKLLQRVCGAHDDGVWGPNTRAAITAACKVRSVDVVARQLIKKKREFYKALAKQDPDQYGGFEEGWLNRTRYLEKFILLA